MKKVKKILALLLVMAFAFAFMAMSASAAEIDNHDCHACAVESESDETVVQPRALACLNCFNGHYSKLWKNSDGTYTYRCNNCGDEIYLNY